jgi:hypothetical protein
VTDHPNLASALAAVQAELPKISKGETAKVDMKGGGSYTYRYADLADISDAVLPLLGRNGLAFTTCPTVNAAGTFVLDYRLRHTSGETVGGEYPLATQGGPQAQGSLITYARRYTLCAVTGVAPEDDDGQAAQRAAEQPAPQPRKVNLAVLNQLIGEAQARGIDGKYDETRTWASQSQTNCDVAVHKLRTIIDSSTAGDGKAPAVEDQPPAPDAPSVEPAGSGEDPPHVAVPLPSSSPDPSQPNRWDVPDQKPADPFDWRDYAKKAGLNQGQALSAGQKALAPDLQVKGPKSLDDACRDEYLAGLVRDAINAAVDS